MCVCDIKGETNNRKDELIYSQREQSQLPVFQGFTLQYSHTEITSWIPSWLHNERIRAVCSGDIWKKSFFWHLLGLHLPLQSVGEKQLTENKDEHLSLAGPRGGNKAAIAATALRKEIAFPSLSFVHTLDALSHNSSGKQEGITDRIGCVTQNSSSPIMQW